MAPIVFAVRSALLYAEPSHDTRASSAATPPSLLIGIPVFIIAVVLAIGTICWVLREKKAAKRLKERRLLENGKPSEIDTTFAGTEVKYRRVSELPGSEVVPPEYFESPQTTSYPATPLFEREDSDSLRYSHPRVPKPFQNAVQSQGHNLSWGDTERSPASRISGPQIRDTSTAAARSDSSKEKECGTPQQFFPYIQRSLLELPDNFLVPRVAPPIPRNGDNLEGAQSQNIVPTHVGPFELDIRPNSVYYSTAAIPSNRLHTTSPGEAYLLDTEVRQASEHNLFDFDFGLGIPEMEMQARVTCPGVGEILMRQPTPDSDRMSIDTEQRDAASPLINDQERPDLNEEMNIQVYHPESSHQQDRVTTDVISSDSRRLQAGSSNHAFDSASARNSAPRKRAAGLDLRPLDIDNTSVESPSNHNRISIDRSRQRRRPTHRTLVSKLSPVQNLKNASSPHSNKSTPDSAKTDLSFASTATQATLSGSSATTTPLLAVESPDSPYTPSEDQLICRDCGQVFNTPGQQKKHYYRQHKLRHVCDICVRPFGVKADLERHEHTVHSELFRSNKRFWCTIPGCKTPTQEWKRKDNFTRHVRSCEARVARVAGANGGSGKGKERA